jgi:hypothetical protein
MVGDSGARMVATVDEISPFPDVLNLMPSDFCTEKTADANSMVGRGRGIRRQQRVRPHALRPKRRNKKAQAGVEQFIIDVRLAFGS